MSLKCLLIYKDKADTSISHWLDLEVLPRIGDRINTLSNGYIVKEIHHNIATVPSVYYRIFCDIQE